MWYTCKVAGVSFYHAMTQFKNLSVFHNKVELHCIELYFIFIVYCVTIHDSRFCASSQRKWYGLTKNPRRNIFSDANLCSCFLHSMLFVFILNQINARALIGESAIIQTDPEVFLLTFCIWDFQNKSWLV